MSTHEPPGTPRDRRPTLLDGMILVATTAVGVAWTKAYVGEYLLPLLGNRGALPQRHLLGYALACLPLLACSSVGLFACQLRSGQWRIGLAMRQASCLAPAMVTVALLANVALMLAVRGVSLLITNWDATYRLAQPLAWSYVLALKMAEAGLLVGGAVLLQVWLGVRAKGSSWIDRLGPLIETAWILLWLIAIGIFESLLI